MFASFPGAVDVSHVRRRQLARCTGGVVSPSNQTAQFTIHYIDTSVIPSDVTIIPLELGVEQAKMK
jgi:hypothetical protein